MTSGSGGCRVTLYIYVFLSVVYAAMGIFQLTAHQYFIAALSFIVMILFSATSYLTWKAERYRRM